MAASLEAKTAKQKDGEIVMEALQNLAGPATFSDVVSHIASRQNVIISAIKEPVKSVLDRGVLMGFIQKQGARYCADLSGINKMDLKSASNAEMDNCRPMPSCCRKRMRCVKRTKTNRRRKSSSRSCSRRRRR